MAKQILISQQSKTNPPNQAPRFISIRWRFITPLFLVVLTVAMTGAYLIARNISGGLEVSQTNVLLQSSRAVADRSGQLYDYHRQEAQRAAFTVGVKDAVRDYRPNDLEPILESLVRVSGLDSLIVVDSAGHELVGILRVETQGISDFSVSSATDLSQQPIIRSILDETSIEAVAFMTTPQGMLLYTAAPIYDGDTIIGVALVGQQLESVLADLRSSAVADLTLYGPDGTLLQTTFSLTENWNSLALSPEVFNQALAAENSLPLSEFFIAEAKYQGTAQPFIFGPNRLGVIGVAMPDHIPFITEAGRQLTALLAAVLAGTVVVVAFAGMSYFAGKAERIAQVADELASGQSAARTHLRPTDEISAIGYALDQYAGYAQERQDELQQELRRQRREAAHLTRVLESIPDGVIVQDAEGRVITMNDRARALLGSQRVFRSAGLHELTAVVAHNLGPALAPGIYTLGHPHRINLDERLLSAQAAAIMSITDHRIGTVILLRDITEQVLQEHQRDILLRQIAQHIQSPLAKMGQLGMLSDSNMVNAFAREITRQAVALQKMIVDMRELALVDTLGIQRRQQPLQLELLIWAVANEWRQIAQANQLTMRIIIECKGLFVLGDEKRLRWAIGNIIDNAIKYNLPGGTLTLEINEESNGMAQLRVRDNGVGIAREERPFLFTRFYRGTPVTSDGKMIRAPGMGQGLYIAKQIFESHGGSILIKTSQRIGTAVYISLPLTAPTGLEISRAPVGWEGETIQLPENFLIELDQNKPR